PGEQVAPRLELLLVGQMAVHQEVGDLGETRRLELLDRIAAVAQDALVAVDEGDGALARPGVAVAVVKSDRAGLRTQRSDVDADLALAADDQREFEIVAVQAQLGGAHEDVRAPIVPARKCIVASPEEQGTCRIAARALDPPPRSQDWRPEAPCSKFCAVSSP